MNGDIRENPQEPSKLHLTRKLMDELPIHRRKEDLWWFRLLDRYGLPTLFSLVLLWFVLNTMAEQMKEMQKEREEFRKVLASIGDSVKENTNVIRNLSLRLDYDDEYHHKRLTVSRPLKGE